MEEGSPNIVVEILSALWSVWREMFSAFWEIFPKVVMFILWVLSALIILPCVFIAGNIYPAWQEWGEGF